MLKIKQIASNIKYKTCLIYIVASFKLRKYQKYRKSTSDDAHEQRHAFGTELPFVNNQLLLSTFRSNKIEEDKNFSEGLI